MMKIKTISSTFLLLAVFNSPLFAKETDNYYLGAALTSVGYNDSNDSTFKVNAGYSLNNYFSVEANYFDFGTYDRFDGSGELDATGYSLEAIAKYPLGDFAVYAKLGNLWWSEEGSISLTTPPIEIDDSGSDLIYGVGASYDISDNVTIKIEYQESEVNTRIANPLSIGLDFKF